MQSVAEATVVTGDVLQLSGTITTHNPDQLSVAYGGAALCNTRDAAGDSVSTAAAAELPLTPSSPASCVVPDVAAGRYNATLTVTAEGSAVAAAATLRADGGPALFQVEHLAVITGFSPAAGSGGGSAAMVITGSGFSDAFSANAVTVGGLPCVVNTWSSTELRCVTPGLEPLGVDVGGLCPPPDPGTGAATAPGAGLGSVTAASRGALLQVWHSVTASDTLENLVTFPNFPHVATSVETMEVAPGEHGVNTTSGVRLVAVFEPPISSEYQFAVAAGGPARLWLHNDVSRPFQAQLVVDTAFAAPFRAWEADPTQLSAPVALSAGKQYYLEMRAVGAGHASVVATLARATFNRRDSAAMRDEVQEIAVGFRSTPTTQRVTLVAPSSGLFHLSLNGKSVSLHTNSDPAVSGAVVARLFNAACFVDQPATIQFFDLDDFEDASNDLWQPVPGAAVLPSIGRPAHCGDGALALHNTYVGGSYAVNFDGAANVGLEAGQTSAGFSSVTYPFMCMAYLFPVGSRASMRIHIAGGVGWRTVTLNADVSDADYPVIGSFPIIDDGAWHHACVDLGDQIDDTLDDEGITTGPEHTVTAIAFHPPRNSSFEEVYGSLFIDDFSISTHVRSVSRVPADDAAQLGRVDDGVAGVVVTAVAVVRVDETVLDVDYTHYDVTFSTLNCSAGLPLLQLEVPAGTTDGFVTVVDAAPAPLQGSFRVSYQGSQYASVDVAASARAVRDGVESLQLAGDAVTVSRAGTCGDLRWRVTFHGLTGASPLSLLDLQFDVGVTGPAPTLNVSRVAHAREVLLPLGAGAVRYPLSVPTALCTLYDGVTAVYQTQLALPLVVRVAGALAACRVPGDVCLFRTSPDITPVVLSALALEPTDGSASPGAATPSTGASASLTLVGSAFSGDIAVLVGRTVCADVTVTAADFTRLTCRLPPRPGGVHFVRVREAVNGISSPGVAFTAGLEVIAAAPSAIGLGGGTELTLTVEGGALVPTDVTVTLLTAVTLTTADGSGTTTLEFPSSCAVVSSSLDAVTCTTAGFPLADLFEAQTALPAFATGTYAILASAAVVAQLGTLATLPAAVQYDDAITHIIASVAPTAGPSYGGTLLTITGQRLACDPADGCTVTVGTAPCVIESFADAQVKCRTTRHRQGRFKVVMLSKTRGLSAPATLGSDEYSYLLRVDIVAVALSQALLPAPALSVSPSPTPSPSPSATQTPSHSVTPSATATPSSTASQTPSTSQTATPSGTPSGTPSPSSSQSVSGSASTGPTGTHTPSASASASASSSSSPSATKTATPSTTAKQSHGTLPTRSNSPSRTATPTPPPSPTPTPTPTPSQTPSFSTSPTQTPSVSPSPSHTMTPTVTPTVTPTPSVTPSASSYVPAVGLAGDVVVDVAGAGFGTPELLAVVAGDQGLTQFQSLIDVDILTYEPAVTAFTMATTAFDGDNPRHPPVFERQVLSLLTAKKTFEQHKIYVAVPGGTIGTFTLSSTLTGLTSDELVIHASAEQVRVAVLQLNLAPVVSVVRSPPGLGAAPLVTWVITYHLELSFPVLEINFLLEDTSNQPVLDGVHIERKREGVTGLTGTWQFSVPGLSLQPSPPLAINASSDAVFQALATMPLRAPWPPFDVVSVHRTVTDGPDSDFNDAGSTTYAWDVTLRLHPAEGEDEHGELPVFATDDAALVDGLGVDLKSTRVVKGQAGRRDVDNAVTVGVTSAAAAGDAAQGATVVVHSREATAGGVRVLLDALSAVEIVDVDVVRHAGRAANDFGYSTTTGYGVGATHVLDGLGAGTTWIVTFVPAGMIETCSVLGTMFSDATLTFDGSSLIGTNVTSTATSLRDFRCTAVATQLSNHTEHNLRVEVPNLSAGLATATEAYSHLLAAPVPSGLWRATAANLGFGTSVTAVPNLGSFGEFGDASTSVALPAQPGFSPRDADPSFQFAGVGSQRLEVPFRQRFNTAAFTLEVWVLPRDVTTLPQLVAISANLPDELNWPSNGYVVALDPCGTLSAWLGQGRSTLQARAGARLLEFLGEPTCAAYEALVAQAAFPWTVVRGAVQQDKWNHIAVVHEPGVGVASLFVDGVQAHRVDVPFPMVTNDVAPLSFGGSVETEFARLFYDGFLGSLDDMAVFNLAVPTWFLRQRTLYGLREADTAVLSPRVTGVASGCRLTNTAPPNLLDSNCVMELAGSATPVVFAAVPPEGVVGDVVTVSGAALSPVAANNLVCLNGVTCFPAAASTPTELQFVVPDAAGLRGLVTITVTVRGLGAAIGAVPFTSLVVVNDMRWFEGSVGGGTVMTITGAGFSVTPGAMRVIMGALTASVGAAAANAALLASTEECVVHLSSELTSTSLTCVTPESVPGQFEVVVDVRLLSELPAAVPPAGLGTLSVEDRFRCEYVIRGAPGCHFEYTFRKTPIISRLLSTEGVAGAAITWQGVGFTDVAAEFSEFSLGGVQCQTLRGITPFQGTCVTAPGAAGQQQVRVAFTREGLAVGPPYSAGLAASGFAPHPWFSDRSLPVWTMRPTLHTVTPASGAAGGGTHVTLRGGSLVAADGTSATTVSIAGTPCDVTFANETVVQCVTRPLAALHVPFDTHAAASAAQPAGLSPPVYATGAVPGDGFSDAQRAHPWHVHDWVLTPAATAADVWSVRGGVLHANAVSLPGAGASSCGCSQPSFAAVGQPDWQDYVLSARVKASPTAVVGLAVRAMHPDGDDVAPDLAAAAHLQLALDFDTGCFQLRHRSESGSIATPELSFSAAAIMTPDVWHVVSLAVYAGEAIALLDGHVLAVVQVPLSTTYHGRAGVFACPGAVALFDDVTIRHEVRHESASGLPGDFGYLPSGGLAPVRVDVGNQQATCNRVEQGLASVPFAVPARRRAGGAATIVQDTACSFQFGAARTPQVTAVSVVSASGGDRHSAAGVLAHPDAFVASHGGHLQLDGYGFPVAFNDVHVTVGGRPCTTRAGGHTTTRLTCDLPATSGGTYAVRVTTPDGSAQRTHGALLAALPAAQPGALFTSAAASVPLLELPPGTFHVVAAVQEQYDIDAPTFAAVNGSVQLLTGAAGGLRAHFTTAGFPAQAIEDEGSIELCGVPCTTLTNSGSNVVCDTGPLQVPGSLPTDGSVVGDTETAAAFAATVMEVHDGAAPVFAAGNVSLSVAPSAPGMVVLAFEGLNIPPGATVLGARLTLASAAADQLDPLTVEVSALTVAGVRTLGPVAAAVAATGVVNPAWLTSTAAAWTMAPWRFAGETHQAPDVAAVVQAAVNSSSWDTGSTVFLTLQPFGDGSSAGGAVGTAGRIAAASSPAGFPAALRAGPSLTVTFSRRAPTVLQLLEDAAGRGTAQLTSASTLACSVNVSAAGLCSLAAHRACGAVSHLVDVAVDVFAVSHVGGSADEAVPFSTADAVAQVALQLTDGSLSTWWSLDGGREAVTVDLGAVTALHTVRLAWHTPTARLWQLQVSNTGADGSFVTVTALTDVSATVVLHLAGSAPHPPPFSASAMAWANGCAGYPAAGVSGRFVRLYFPAADTAVADAGELAEVEVSACAPHVADAALTYTQRFSEQRELPWYACNETASGGNFTFIEDPTNTECPEQRRVVFPRNTTFTFPSVSVDAAVTPVIQSVHPAHVAAAGGDTITVRGSGFAVPGAAVNVTAGDAPCLNVVVAPAGDALTCESAAQPSSRGLRPVTVTVGSMQAVVEGSACGVRLFSRWSHRATWDGFGLPIAGESVVVAPDDNVLLDVSTPALGTVFVQGHLVLEDVSDVTLTARSIVVMDGGLLEAGTPAAPFTHRAVIQLTGAAPALSATEQAAAEQASSTALASLHHVLLVTHGTLHLHGTPTLTSWTALAATAPAGASTVSLVAPVDWPVGSDVVVSATDHRGATSELRTVASVDGGGFVVRFTTPLTHAHLGGPRVFAGYPAPLTTELAAKVGLLTRTVSVVGPDTLYQALQGGSPVPLPDEPASGLPPTDATVGSSVRVQPSGPQSATLRIRHAEFKHLGDARDKARAALWVAAPAGVDGVGGGGSAADSYVDACSFHRLSGRGVVVASVHQLLVRGNVLHHAVGTAVELLHGAEQDLRIVDNLVVVVRAAHQTVPSDATPAGFLLRNPHNVVTGNVAVGCASFGFRLLFPDAPVGAGAAPGVSANICPSKTPLLMFSGNSAAACGSAGLSLESGYRPRQLGCRGGPAVRVAVKNFVAFRNAAVGVAVADATPTEVTACVVADNWVAGVEVAAPYGGPRSSDATQDVVVRAVVVVGALTDAQDPHPEPPTPAVHVGIVAPTDHGFSVANCTFHNFGDAEGRWWALGACARCEKFAPLGGGFQATAAGLEWHASPHRVHWRWSSEGMWVDADGSITGAASARTMVPANAMLRSLDGCTEDVAHSGGPPGGLVCVGHTFRRLALNGTLPLTQAPVAVSIVGADSEVTMVPYHAKRATHPRGYVVVVATNRVYRLDFQEDLTALAFDTSLMQAPEYVILRLIYLQRALRTDVRVNGQLVPDSIGPRINEGDVAGSWYFDELSRTATVVLNTLTTDGTTPRGSYEFVLCTVANGCLPSPQQTLPSVGVGGDTPLRWSSAATWQSLGLPFPATGLDVVVPAGVTVLLDVETPILRVVTVHGALVFDADAVGAVVLKASHVIVVGYLYIGDLYAPFPGNATIKLYGDPDAPRVTYGTVDVGAKVLAVFGTVRATGQRRVRTWTRLVQPAAAGDTSLFVRARLDWAAGEDILVASTGFDGDHTETRTVVSSTWRTEGVTEVVVSEPLTFRHASERVVDGDRWRVVEAEVGLVTRTVTIESAEEADEDVRQEELEAGYRPTADTLFGAAVRVATGVLPDVSQDFQGDLTLQHVALRGMGQHNVDRGEGVAVGVPGLLTPPDAAQRRDVLLEGCTFHGGYAHNVGVYETFKRVHVQWTVSIDAMGGLARVSDLAVTNGAHILEDNLAVNVRLPPPLDAAAAPGRQPTASAWNSVTLGASYTSYPAGFQVFTAGVGSFARNAVAGSQGAGFLMTAEPGACSNPAASVVTDLVAHSCAFGFVLVDGAATGDTCDFRHNFTAYSNWEYGVYGSTTAAVVLDAGVVVGNTVGVYVNVHSPATTSHGVTAASVTLTRCMFAAGLASTWGDAQSCAGWAQPPPQVRHPWSWGTGAVALPPIVGLLAPTFSSHTVKPLGVAPPHAASGPPGLVGVTNAHDTWLVRYQNGTCGRTVAAVASNPLAVDAGNAVRWTSTTAQDTDTLLVLQQHSNGGSAGLATCPTTVARVGSAAAAPECNGRRHALLNDADGTLFNGTEFASGVPAPRSVVADPGEQVWGVATVTAMDVRTVVPAGTEDAAVTVGDRLEGALGYAPRSTWVVAPPRVAGCQRGDSRGAPGAWVCPAVYRSLMIESYDADRFLGTLQPVVVATETTPASAGAASTTWLDVLHGTANHTGNCPPAAAVDGDVTACPASLDVFQAVVPLGGSSAVMFSRVNPPQNLRLHLPGSFAAAEDGVVVSIVYDDPQLLTVSVPGFGVVHDVNSVNDGAEPRMWGDPAYVPVRVTAAMSAGVNAFDRASGVLSVVVRGGVPVDVQMNPVLSMVIELQALPAAVLAARATVTAGVAQAVPYPLNLVRLVDIAQGSLPGTTFAHVQLQPFEWPCNVSEASFLSYCDGDGGAANRRRRAQEATAVPLQETLLTDARVSMLKVTRARLEAAALAGTLESAMGFVVGQRGMDLTNPPSPPSPLGEFFLADGGAGNGTADADLPLRSGTFGFERVTLRPVEGEGNATLHVVRTRSSFGVVTIDFVTEEGEHGLAGLHYATSSGTLQFLPGDTVKAIEVPLVKDALFSWPQRDFVVKLTAIYPAEDAFFATGGTEAHVTIVNDDPITTCRFAERVVHVHPDFPSVTVHLRRVGNLLANAFVTVVEEAVTVNGLTPVRGLHYTIADELPGRTQLENATRYVMGEAVQERPLFIDVLPQAAVDLRAVALDRGTLDAVYVLRLHLAEGFNTLVPTTADNGLTLDVRITLEAGQPGEHRLGAWTAVAVTLGVLLLLLAACALYRHRRSLKDEERRFEASRKDAFEQAAHRDEESGLSPGAGGARPASPVHKFGRSYAARRQLLKARKAAASAKRAAVVSPHRHDDDGDDDDDGGGGGGGDNAGGVRFAADEAGATQAAGGRRQRRSPSPSTRPHKGRLHANSVDSLAGEEHDPTADVEGDLSMFRLRRHLEAEQRRIDAERRALEKDQLSFVPPTHGDASAQKAAVKAAAKAAARGRRSDASSADEADYDSDAGGSHLTPVREGKASPGGRLVPTQHHHPATGMPLSPTPVTGPAPLFSTDAQLARAQELRAARGGRLRPPVPDARAMAAARVRGSGRRR